MDIYIESSVPNLPLYILVCTDDEHYMVHEDIEICERLSWDYKPCVITQKFSHSVRIYYTFQEFGDYSFYLVHCEPQTTNIKLHLSLLNPNGNNLESSLIPAPTMFIIMAALWAVVLLVWMVVAIPQWKNMTAIHYVMLTYPVFKIIYEAYSADYFHSFQISGVVELTPWIMYRVFVIIVLLDFHFILLLLSKAWSISGNLDKSDFHLMFSMLIGLCCSLMFKYLYEEASDVTFLLASLAYIGLRVMILACIFININHTIGRFEAEMLNYNADVEQIQNRQVIVKLHKVFILFKFSLMLWVILNVAEFFCNILFFSQNDQNWVDMMNTEFIDFLLGICLGILLLPNVSLQPLFDPSLNEYGEHELTTFHATSENSPSPSQTPSSTPLQQITSTATDSNDDEDSGHVIVRSSERGNGRNRGGGGGGGGGGMNGIIGRDNEIEISNDEDDDEVELVDSRHKRRLRV